MLAIFPTGTSQKFLMAFSWFFVILIQKLWGEIIFHDDVKSLGFSWCLELHLGSTWKSSGTDNPLQFYRFLKTYGNPLLFFLFPDFLKFWRDAQEWASFKVHGTSNLQFKYFLVYWILAVSITERSFRAPLSCLWMPPLGWLNWPSSAALLFRTADMALFSRFTPERELAFLKSNNTKRS